MDGRDKRVKIAAGKGRRQGMAADDKSVDNRQVAGGKEGNGGKSNGNDKKGGGQATAMATAKNRAMAARVGGWQVATRAMVRAARAISTVTKRTMKRKRVTVLRVMVMARKRVARVTVTRVVGNKESYGEGGEGGR
jgi:hypothetical protein